MIQSYFRYILQIQNACYISFDCYLKKKNSVGMQHLAIYFGLQLSLNSVRVEYGLVIGGFCARLLANP